MVIDNSNIQEFVEDVVEEPDCMTDQPRPQAQELELLNLTQEGEYSRHIFIMKDISKEKREALVEFIREFIDIFA